MINGDSEVSKYVKHSSPNSDTHWLSMAVYWDTEMSS